MKKDITVYKNGILGRLKNRRIMIFDNQELAPNSFRIIQFTRLMPNITKEDEAYFNSIESPSQFLVKREWSNHAILVSRISISEESLLILSSMIPEVFGRTSTYTTTMNF